MAVTAARLLDYLAGKITRRTLLGAVLPCLFASYFGMLVLAVVLFPHRYDWRVLSISQLLYPRQNPGFYPIAASGVAVSGMLIVPFAGYLQRRFRLAAPIGATFGAVCVAGGAVGLTLAALISSHPMGGESAVPRLHAILAKVAAIGIGVGLLMFAGCGVKGHFKLSGGRQLYPRGLLLVWSLTLLPALLVLMGWLALRTRPQWLEPIKQLLAGTAVWHVGFWEWIGSGIVWVILAGSVWLLPEHAGD